MLMAYFPLQKQEQFFWCWAALTKALLEHFDYPEKLSQTDIVQKFKGKVVDEPALIHEVMASYGLLKEGIPYPVNFEKLQSGLEDGPIILVIQHYGMGGAHLVALVDIKPHRVLELHDPQEAEVHLIGFEEFAQDYKKKGTWANTIFSQHPAVSRFVK